MTKKVNEALYGLRFIKHCTTQSLWKRLVESLVIPHLDYCSVVYHGASFSLRKRLQRLANEGIIYIFGLRRDTHITPYRRQLGWMRSDPRRKYFALLILYRIVRMSEPPILLPFFTQYQSDRPTRGVREDLEIGSAPLNAFQTRCAKTWNYIPPFICDQPSYSGFKKGIKQYLTNLDF